MLDGEATLTLAGRGTPFRRCQGTPTDFPAPRPDARVDGGRVEGLHVERDRHFRLWTHSGPPGSDRWCSSDASTVVTGVYCQISPTSSDLYIKFNPTIFFHKSNFRSMSPKPDPLPVVTSDGPIHRSLSLDSRAERTPATAFCQPHGSIEICLPFRVTHRDLQIRPYIHGSNLGAVPLVRYRVHLNLIHFSTDIFFLVRTCWSPHIPP
jgi:hypothetical protein